MICRALFVTALGLAAAPIPSAAAADAGTSCHFSYSPRLDPGLTLTASSGKVTSAPGVADCSGTLNGATVTGPGEFDFQGAYSNATCQGGGTGTGFINARIPTYTGTVVIHDPMSFAFGPDQGFPPGVGDWHGKRTVGQYVVLPVQGDCVSSPVTEAKGQGPFRISD